MFDNKIEQPQIVPMFDLDKAIEAAERRAMALELELADVRTKLEQFRQSKALAGEFLVPLQAVEAASAVDRPPKTLKEAVLGVIMSDPDSWFRARDVADRLVRSAWTPISDNFSTTVGTTLSRLAEDDVIEQQKDGGGKRFKSKLE